jgi:hypothetical protein
MRGPDIGDQVVASHIRALQASHLVDVASSDQHTVKPWFDGRLDYAPPLRDLAAQGFPLEGGRLDYVDGRPVSALVYRRARHAINLFVWPAASHREREPSSRVVNGYNIVRWSEGDMAFWAVSDDLDEFVRLWRPASGRTGSNSSSALAWRAASLDIRSRQRHHRFLRGEASRALEMESDRDAFAALRAVGLRIMVDLNAIAITSDLARHDRRAPERLAHRVGIITLRPRLDDADRPARQEGQHVLQRIPIAGARKFSRVRPPIMRGLVQA